MIEERNWILHKAVPKLQLFATKNYLDFQLVDLRWGLSEEIECEPENLPVYLEQIEYCRTLSAGPSFVVNDYSNQSINQPNQSYQSNQSIDQSISQSINQWVNKIFETASLSMMRHWSSIDSHNQKSRTIVVCGYRHDFKGLIVLVSIIVWMRLWWCDQSQSDAAPIMPNQFPRRLIKWVLACQPLKLCSVEQ